MSETQSTSTGSPFKLGVALGGGGMKGLAHIGALSVLEELGLKPDLVVGTSMGAMVGAFYATGMPVADIRTLFTEQKLIDFLSPRFDGKSLVGSDGLRSFLQSHLPFTEFETLPVSFRAVCTDLTSGSPVTLSSGDLVSAVLASACVPGIFAPVHRDGLRLVDGALSDNLPVRILAELGAQKTIGVRLFSTEMWNPENAPPIEEDPDQSSWRRFLSRNLLRFTPGGFRVLQRSLEIVIDQLEQKHLDDFPPDILIDPDVSDLSVLGYLGDRDPLFDRGREAAENQKSALLDLLES